MLPKQMKRYRAAMNVSQAKLAKALNVTQQAVAQWETGKTTPDPKTLEEISNYFNISVDELLGIKPNKKDNRNDLNTFLSQSKIMFNGELYNLNDDERKMVMKALEIAFYAAKKDVDSNK